MEQLRHVTLEDPADQQTRQDRGRGRGDELVERHVERRPEAGGRGQLVLHELSGTLGVERLGEQGLELVDHHATRLELDDEGVVLLAGAVGPHDVVEEQLVDVGRGEPAELEAGAVDDRLLEQPDLGVDVECHGGLSDCCRRMKGQGGGEQRGHRYAGTGVGSVIEGRIRR